MLDVRTSHLQARLAAGPEDLRRAQSLRYLAFRATCGEAGSDEDRFDAACTHVLIEETGTGRLVCCYRLMPLRTGAEIAQSYSAQFYDLAPLQRFPGPMAELGRFCVHPERTGDPDILRVAWGVLTRYVDEAQIEMLFGCSSFAGTDHTIYGDAFAMLRARHLAPAGWRPGIKSPDVFRFAETLTQKPVAARALRTMPPLLRTYLMMGGWVSDHAVIDRDLNTLHVFTGLEIAAIPAARAKALRDVAQTRECAVA
ncbi:MAG: GNAT family N-acyltransferase [Pseudomonadota bacterium]